VKNKLQQMSLYLEQHKKPKIVVLGDLILDKYLYASIDRICPEAPCPIALIDSSTEELRLGGAANVANNLVSLGANVNLLGVVGTDYSGDSLERLAREGNCIKYPFVKDLDRPTTTKTRVLSKQHSQIAIRLDEEINTRVSGYITSQLIAQLYEIREDIDYLVLSDYGKGVVTEELINAIKNLGLAPQTIIDPNKRNLDLYTGFFLLKPNMKDLQFSDFLDQKEIEKIYNKANCSKLIITLAKEGAFLWDERRGYASQALAQEIIDVTGAGDTTTASLAFALSLGYNIREALDFSMAAASSVVSKQGTSTTTLKEILSSLEED